MNKCCEQKLRTLASAMRKVMPREMVREIIDRSDPLGAFLRDMGAAGAPWSQSEDCREENPMTSEPTLAGAPFHFVVPLLPPSVNHYKKPRRGGGWYRAADAIAFVDAVCLLSHKTKVTGNFYALELWFFLGPSKRNLSSNDVDNFQKVAIDALVRATVIKTDGRVLDLHVHKRFVATDRQERTEYFVTGRQLDEGKVFPERDVPLAVGRHTAAGSETA